MVQFSIDPKIFKIKTHFNHLANAQWKNKYSSYVYVSNWRSYEHAFISRILLQMKRNQKPNPEWSKEQIIITFAL